jgi:hypothetical protein
MRVQPASATLIRSNCVVSSSIYCSTVFHSSHRMPIRLRIIGVSALFAFSSTSTMAAFSFAGSAQTPCHVPAGMLVVDDRRAPRDEPVSNPVDRLQVQLVVRLDRDEAHVLALDGLSHGFCIHEVVLVRLHKGLHELSCDQPHVMAFLPQRSTEKRAPE